MSSTQKVKYDIPCTAMLNSNVWKYTLFFYLIWITIGGQAGFSLPQPLGHFRVLHISHGYNCYNTHGSKNFYGRKFGADVVVQPPLYWMCLTFVLLKLNIFKIVYSKPQQIFLDKCMSPVHIQFKSVLKINEFHVIHLQ